MGYKRDGGTGLGRRPNRRMAMGMAGTNWNVKV